MLQGGFFLLHVHFELYRDKHGFVIGALDSAAYREYTIELQPGDAVFVYTDGVPEANDAAGQLFGTGRLLQALNRDPNASCRDLLGSVKAAVDEFVQDAPQFDDTTMLALKYLGNIK
jgi:sigma-B regulation protein RsbU (phosphoserine phosphatase)